MQMVPGQGGHWFRVRLGYLKPTMHGLMGRVSPCTKEVTVEVLRAICRTHGCGETFLKGLAKSAENSARGESVELVETLPWAR